MICVKIWGWQKGQKARYVSYLHVNLINPHLVYCRLMQIQHIYIILSYMAWYHIHICLTLNPSLSDGTLRLSDAHMRQKTNHHWFRHWLGAWPTPSHYLNQCCNSFNLTLRINLQCNFNRNSNIFIHENAFENVIFKMASIFPRS